MERGLQLKTPIDQQVDSTEPSLKSQFEEYLSLISDDLSKKSGCKSISLYTFLKYSRLPGYLSQRLFTVLKNQNESNLSQKAFINGLSSLYLGTKEEQLIKIFNIINIGESQVLTRINTRIFLSHSLIINQESYYPFLEESSLFKELCQDQSNKNKFIQNLLKRTFKKNGPLNLQEFREQGCDLFDLIIKEIQLILPCTTHLSNLQQQLVSSKQKVGSDATPKIIQNEKNPGQQQQYNHHAFVTSANIFSDQNIFSQELPKARYNTTKSNKKNPDSQGAQDLLQQRNQQQQQQDLSMISDINPKNESQDEDHKQDSFNIEQVEENNEHDKDNDIDSGSSSQEDILQHEDYNEFNTDQGGCNFPLVCISNSNYKQMKTNNLSGQDQEEMFQTPILKCKKRPLRAKNITKELIEDINSSRSSSGTRRNLELQAAALSSQQNNNAQNKAQEQYKPKSLFFRRHCEQRRHTVSQHDQQEPALVSITHQQEIVSNCVQESLHDEQSPSLFRNEVPIEKPLYQKQGQAFLKCQDNSYKKVYIRLQGSDILFYREQINGKQKIRFLHSLVGCFVQEGPKDTSAENCLKAENNNYPALEINLSQNVKRAVYFCYAGDRDEWIQALKIAAGSRKVSDHYELEQYIAEGSYGKVYRASLKSLGRTVAIKQISKKDFTDEMLLLTVNEIDILKSCDHPNIIKLLDSFEDYDNFYIVLEFFQGSNLSSFAKDRRNVNERNVVKLLHELFDGLNYIHSMGIVHRDIKLENIMMSTNEEDAVPKIIDFGLSAILAHTEKAIDAYGTLAYCAPEILLKQPYNSAIDIWCLGITFYMIITSQHPFIKEDKKMTIRAIVNQEINFNNDAWRRFSWETIQLIAKMLDKNPDRRVQVRDYINSNSNQQSI